MFTDIGMDTGDMLMKREVEITEDMTSGELHDRLAVVGAQVLRDTIERLVESKLHREPQPHDCATYAPMIQKEMGLIDWSRPCHDIHNLIRGLNPWPVAYTAYKGEKFKIWRSKPTDMKLPGRKPGTICEIMKDGLMVATGDKLLKVLEIQFESGRRMNVSECGHNMDEGEVLG
jgi:methionyl-tRNA formyltransferase